MVFIISESRVVALNFLRYFVIFLAFIGIWFHIFNLFHLKIFYFEFINFFGWILPDGWMKYIDAGSILFFFVIIVGSFLKSLILVSIGLIPLSVYFMAIIYSLIELTLIYIPVYFEEFYEIQNPIIFDLLEYDLLPLFFNLGFYSFIVSIIILLLALISTSTLNQQQHSMDKNNSTNTEQVTTTI